MKTFANTTISLNVADLIAKACELAYDSEKAACGEFCDSDEAISLLGAASVCTAVQCESGVSPL